MTKQSRQNCTGACNQDRLWCPTPYTCRIWQLEEPPARVPNPRKTAFWQFLLSVALAGFLFGLLLGAFSKGLMK
jgi:hypothetical protein